MSERLTASEFDREVASDLKGRGGGDPGAGLARTIGTLVESLVARQRVIDEVTTDIRTKREKARIRHERTLAEARQSRTDRSERARAEAESSESSAIATRDETVANVGGQLKSKLDELRATHETELAHLKRGLEEGVLMAEAMREAGEEAARVRGREVAERLRRATNDATELEGRAKAYLRSCRLPVPASSAEPSPEPAMPAEQELAQLLIRANEHLETLLATRAARLLSGPTPFLLAGALVIGAGVIGGASTLFDETRWVKIAAISAGGALAVVVVLLVVLRGIANTAMKRVWQPFSADLAAIARAKERAEREEAAAREANQLRLRETEAREERDAHVKYDGPIAEVPKALRRRRERAEASAAAAIAEARALC
ncbi:MAG: hypothetical protein ACKO3W_07580, partial [bacterium]